MYCDDHKNLPPEEICGRLAGHPGECIHHEKIDTNPSFRWAEDAPWLLEDKVPDQPNLLTDLVTEYEELQKLHAKSAERIRVLEKTISRLRSEQEANLK